jgi:hypothetical protein
MPEFLRLVRTSDISVHTSDISVHTSDISVRRVYLTYVPPL